MSGLAESVWHRGFSSSNAADTAAPAGARGPSQWPVLSEKAGAVGCPPSHCLGSSGVD